MTDYRPVVHAPVVVRSARVAPRARTTGRLSVGGPQCHCLHMNGLPTGSPYSMLVVRVPALVLYGLPTGSPRTSAQNPLVGATQHRSRTFVSILYPPHPQTDLLKPSWVALPAGSPYIML